MKRGYMIILAGIFVACFLMLVVFGAETYRKIAATRQSNNEYRALTTYLTTVAASVDQEKSCVIFESEYGTVLSLGDEGYRRRIYLSDGYLVEDYAPAAAELNPRAAQKLAPCEQFQVASVDSQTVRVTTDAGETILCFRSTSGKGGTP